MEEGAPAPLGPQPHPGKQPRPLSLSLLTSNPGRRSGDGADPCFEGLLKGPDQLVGVKHVASTRHFLSCHKPCLARRKPQLARCPLDRVGDNRKGPWHCPQQ